MTAVNTDLATRVELEAALAALTPQDLIKLKRLAQLRSAGLPQMAWGDLLQEAIVRALSGSRGWPRRVALLAFLAQTMRSIANEAWLGVQRTDAAMSQMAGLDEDDVDPAREAAVADTLNAVYALFKDDAEAIAVLRGMAQSATPAETQQAGGMTALQYAAAQKRIRRRLAGELARRNLS